MVDQARGGVIINMSSLGGIRSSFVGMAHYEASKGGIVNLTMSTALELAPHGIRAIAIAPGMILTEGVQANLAGAEGGSVDEMLKDFGSKIPLGRFGHADDIARTVVFLASDAADYITGTTIVVDGGKLLT
jgi:2-deoxy-D-gluconate 3-dehydrogenase